MVAMALPENIWFLTMNVVKIIVGSLQYNKDIDQSGARIRMELMITYNTFYITQSQRNNLPQLSLDSKKLGWHSQVPCEQIAFGSLQNSPTEQGRPSAILAAEIKE